MHLRSLFSWSVSAVANFAGYCDVDICELFRSHIVMDSQFSPESDCEVRGFGIVRISGPIERIRGRVNLREISKFFSSRTLDVGLRVKRS